MGGGISGIRVNLGSPGGRWMRLHRRRRHVAPGFQPGAAELTGLPCPGLKPRGYVPAPSTGGCSRPHRSERLQGFPGSPSWIEECIFPGHMRVRPLHGLCLALVLLGLAWSLGGIDPLSVPSGDEATYVLATQSLWHDRDLSWDRQDLARAGRLWGRGPAGLTLLTNDGGKTLRYARPLVYPAAALPFYALFGVRGFAVLNMLLFLGMAAAGLYALRDETGAAALFAAGFFFASAFFAGVFRAGPEVFTGACLFFSLFLWRRGQGLRSFAATGLLLAAAAFAAPWTALLALPVLADLVLRRRVREALAVLLPALLAFGVLALVEWRLTGDWTAQGGVQRRTFESEFPLETSAELWQGYRGAEPASDLATGLRLLPRNALYLLAGRHSGLLPYFPFALLALGLALTKPG